MTLRRGCLWLAAGLLLATLAGVATFVFVQRMAVATKPVTEPPKVEVLVAGRDIALQTVLAQADVEVQEVPPDMVPQGALTNPEQALGQLTMADITEGEIILRQRLIAPDYVGAKAAFVMDPQKVIIAFPIVDLLNTIGIVRPGDHVDLMMTYDFSKARPNIEASMTTLTTLQDLQVAAIVRGPSDQEGKPGPAQALLFAVDPQDALLIKHLRDTGAAMEFALRSPAARGEFEVEPVDGDYLLTRYEIRWRVKEAE